MKNSFNKIFAIQSHVVSGYVGNKCCILPLQIHGNEVDFINTVQFSNHTGYKSIKGQVLKGEEIRELFDGLKENNLVNYDYILTGYVGSNSQLEEICKIVTHIKKSNPSAKYYCDPVLGDNGKMYVPENLREIYHNRIIALADVIFPNQFEMELLTNTMISSEADAITGIDLLHKLGVEMVVITSTNLGPDSSLYGYVSRYNKQTKSQSIWRLEMKKFNNIFVGTGDLFVALFLSWMIKLPDNIDMVCSNVISSMELVLHKTLDRYQKLSQLRPESTTANIELNLVQSISGLLNPPKSGKVVKIK